jgi:hypothetical protein
MKDNAERKEQYIDRVARQLNETFVTRSDCFATQLDDGRYVSVKRDLTLNHIKGHLRGDMTLGVYLLGTDGKAKFSVIDADDDDGFGKLIDAQHTLRLPSYLERSRRGGHLWFFFEEPVAGKVAKNFGLEIAKVFLIEAEVFPKQSESQGPGSSIRLPFGIHRRTRTRYPFVGLGDWRAQIDALANPKRVPTSEVMKYQYKEPERKKATPTPGEITGELPLWEKVKRAITVEELVSEYVDLSRSGVGKCPFHDDSSPSFSVNVKENYWHCFSGCGGGSVIDFWMKLNNLDFKEALTDLAERLGVK